MTAALSVLVLTASSWRQRGSLRPEPELQAAVAFAKGYQNFPEGAKAQDNLLKLALSLGSLGKQPEACASLAQLAVQFPDASPTIKRRAAAEIERLGC